MELLLVVLACLSLDYEESYSHAVGDNLEFNFALRPELCTVMFISSSEQQLEIVRKGRVWDNHFGHRLTLRPSIVPVFSIRIEELEVEDSGVYEKSASKSTVPAPGTNPLPTEGPASHLQQYSAEPGPPRYSVEPRPPVNPGYAYAYQPGNPAPTSTAMYTPAPVLPYPVPAAPQAPVLGGGGEGRAAAPDAGPTTNFLCSDADPHFEMKGLSLATPLSSGSTSADVYTSDKLNMNFL
ncbi:hypothetical protein CRUP_009857 [Coryphaenoides rupestris]|nr:hypothetical protein CRUP_009857 [Coryphaenoides rupestris]